MLVFVNDDNLYDKCCIILEFHRRFTLTSRAVTCVTMAMQNNVLKPQGSALCKQTAMSHMCVCVCARARAHVTLSRVSYIVLSLDMCTRDHKMTNGFSCIYTKMRHHNYISACTVYTVSMGLPPSPIPTSSSSSQLSLLLQLICPDVIVAVP